MIVKQKRIRLLFPFIALLLTLSLTIAGCGDTPTPKPQPTFALEVSPGTEVQVGRSVAIVAKVEPLEKLDLEWSVSGTAEGTLNADTGEQVVYTAGKEGTDIVVAEGTTASGAPVKQTVTLTVVGGAVVEVSPTSPPQPPTDTPSPSPTETPTPVLQTPSPTPECESFRPPIVGPSVGGEVKITSLENCTTGLPSATKILIAGTYHDIPQDLELWILVYPTDLKYYPQSSDDCKQLPALRSGGRWNVNIVLGGEDFPEQFDVVAVLADTQASQAFKDYLKTGCDTGRYEGFSILPEGQITEMDFIIVFTTG
jgi:hypothetical protein